MPSICHDAWVLRLRIKEHQIEGVANCSAK
jgi:hypothetical protein